MNYNLEELGVLAETLEKITPELECTYLVKWIHARAWIGDKWQIACNHRIPVEQVEENDIGPWIQWEIRIAKTNRCSLQLPEDLLNQPMDRSWADLRTGLDRTPPNIKHTCETEFPYYTYSIKARPRDFYRLVELITSGEFINYPRESGQSDAVVELPATHTHVVNHVECHLEHVSPIFKDDDPPSHMWPLQE